MAIGSAPEGNSFFFPHWAATLAASDLVTPMNRKSRVMPCKCQIPFWNNHALDIRTQFPPKPKQFI